MTQFVSVESHGDIRVVTIDRPPANAMSPELLAEGLAVAEQLRSERPAAVDMSGRPGWFSGGLDLKLLPTLDANTQAGMVDGINRLFTAWYSVPFPVVAAVTGHAVAGGMILALCCDYRVAGHSGSFGLTEVRVGVPYPAAALAVVRAELDPPAARRLTLKAALIDAAEAMSEGLVDEQVDDEQVVERALVVAGELAELPARAYEQTKLALRGETIAELEQVIAAGDRVAEGWLER